MYRSSILVVVLIASSQLPLGLGLSFPFNPEFQDTVSVSVDTDSSIFLVDENFLSFTLDTYFVTVHLRGFNASSPKLRNVARGLAPAVFRVGGTSADTIVFKSPSRGFNVMTEQDFDAIHSFAMSAGFEMSYDLNLLYRNNSQWNSSNAAMLLEYAASTGQIIDLELGNEPNLYEFTKHVDPTQIGRDYVHLRSLMNAMPQFSTRRLIGPSVTHAFTEDYAAKFLSTGSTSVDVFSIHHYYSSGPALTPQDMVNPAVLDNITDTLNKARDVVAKYSRGTHTVWLGETGLAYSRSAPNTTGYIAGFMWLDKIGMSATHGVSLLARQSFPSLYDKNETPTPEYWVTFLFKRLVGRRVLRVTSSEGNHYFRVYAHCSLNHPGGVAFYFLNIYRSDVELTIPSFTSHRYELFSLSAGGNGTMSTSIVNLNGNPVTMDGENLPNELLPVTSQTWPVVIPKFTYGFLVLPDVYIMACR